MAHSFQTKHYTFISNSDMSGNVEIVNREGKRFWVMGDELLDFIAHKVRQERFAAVENLTSKQLLGLK